MLDGESWFETAVSIAESTHRRLIIVGIDSSGQRNHDYVPSNTCTPNGGGEGAYFDFVRQELLPYVEGTIGGDPNQRALFGHSHGGSFVFYAMFSEAPGAESFKAYLASDASISCMPAVAYGWERNYASAQRELPARLHISYATLGNYVANIDYANAVAQRNYERLTLAAQAYTGTHGGIVPQALADGIAFAFLAGP
jgi:predicted alpha/beta superfamily hydrolase